LDLVLTTDENLIGKVKAGERFDRSDHQLIRWALSADVHNFNINSNKITYISNSGLSSLIQSN